MSSTLVDGTPVLQGTENTANTVLDDLVDAINTYPKTYLTVEIFDVNPEGTGTGINEHEDVTFKVHVRNTGPLDVLQLRVFIKSEAGADGVKYHDGTAFNPSMFSTPIDLVPGHMHDGDWVETPEHYHFKAGDVSHGKIDLVTVSVDSWDGGLNHVLNGHSDPDPTVKDTLAKSVLQG